MSDSGAFVTVPVRTPYRLDLTATVLRRLSTNIVDVFDGRTYRRALAAPLPALLEVTQTSAHELAVRVDGDVHGAAALLPLVRRMLGTDVDLEPFYAAAAGLGWLTDLVVAARGVKPPRYPSVWEAVVNAVVFQQVSIHAAAAILRRLVERYEPVRAHGPVALAPFVRPQAVVDADPVELRALGLSINKIVALRTLGRAVLMGELDPQRLESVSTDELAAFFTAYKGVGPWTAAVVALRGFGRLDIFPGNDSGVARTLKELSGDPGIDAAPILARLGAQRGMLYYHLLLGRLAARGEIVLGPP